MPLSYNDEVTYEKTPDYFDRPFVPERMAQMNDSVKIISILCDPVHRAYSHFLHAFAVQDSLKIIVDFVKFYEKFCHQMLNFVTSRSIEKTSIRLAR